jgi:hypothetical protein
MRLKEREKRCWEKPLKVVKSGLLGDDPRNWREK